MRNEIVLFSRNGIKIIFILVGKETIADDAKHVRACRLLINLTSYASHIHGEITTGLIAAMNHGNHSIMFHACFLNPILPEGGGGGGESARADIKFIVLKEHSSNHSQTL